MGVGQAASNPAPPVHRQGDRPGLELAGRAGATILARAFRPSAIGSKNRLQVLLRIAR